MAAAIIPPALVILIMFSSAISLSGISLGTSISLLLSFSATAAALVMRESDIPAAIFASVFIEHGITTMALKIKLPELILAATSLSSYENDAIFLNDEESCPVSYWIT